MNTKEFAWSVAAVVVAILVVKMFSLDSKVPQLI